MPAGSSPCGCAGVTSHRRRLGVGVERTAVWTSSSGSGGGAATGKGGSVSGSDQSGARPNSCGPSGPAPSALAITDDETGAVSSSGVRSGKSAAVGGRRHRCGRPRYVSEGGARRLEGARGRQVVGRLRDRVFEFGDRARGVAAVEQRASQRHPRRDVGRVSLEPLPAHGDGFGESARAAMFLREGGKGASASHATACGAGAVRAGCLSACASFLAGPGGYGRASTSIVLGHRRTLLPRALVTVSFT